MDKGKIEAAVREFDAIARNVEAVADDLGELVGMQPESRLMDALFRTLGAYMRAIGEPLAIDSWLEFWWLECGLGDHPKMAGLKGGPLRDINTLDDMVKLIIDDLERVDVGDEAPCAQPAMEVFVPEYEWNAHYPSIQENLDDGLERGEYQEGDEFKMVRLLVGACTTYAIKDGKPVPVAVSFPKGLEPEGGGAHG